MAGSSSGRANGKAAASTSSVVAPQLPQLASASEPSKPEQSKPRPRPRAAAKTLTGLFPGSNRCFLNAILQQHAACPVFSKFVNTAVASARSAHGVDAKGPVDRKEITLTCEALSVILGAIRDGKVVPRSDLDNLCKAIKLGGLSQQDSHEAFVKTADSVQSTLKFYAEVLSGYDCNA